MSGLFFICAIACAFGALFTFMFIPRTKDKSMYELEILFSKYPKSKNPKSEKAFGEVDLFDSESIMKSEVH